MIAKTKGFILTSKTVDIKGHAIIHLFCVNEDGPFLVKISDQKGVFFIERSQDSKNIPALIERKQILLKTVNFKEVDALYFKSEFDLYKARTYCKDYSIRTYESDIKTQDRYLMERFINGSIEVQGQLNLTQSIKVYENAKVQTSMYRPKLSLLSLDIETSMTNDIYSVAFHYKNSQVEIKRVVMIDEYYDKEKKTEGFEYISHVKNEKKLLLETINIINELDPDLILGWHIIGFDFDFLLRKAQEYQIKFNIGRMNGALSIRERKGSGWFSNIDGRVILDGPFILRGAFYQFENYKLDTVATEVLGEKKEINKTGLEKTQEITRRFNHDKEALATYNLKDCTLVLDIFEKLKIIDLLLTRVQISGLLLNRIGASTAAFDHFYLPHFHRQGFVASNITDINRTTQSGGGLVVEPIVGLHEHILAMDFKSLYPSIIRTFKIDPLSLIRAKEFPLRTPSNHTFSKTNHILPSFIEKLLIERQLAKDNDDKNLSQSIKILMNSFYGVMGSGGSRFYHADLPDAITRTGQWILRECIDFLSQEGFIVLYGDTDSVFFKIKDKDKSNAFKAGKKIETLLNKYFTKIIQSKFGVQSHLEIEFEKYYKCFFLPLSRTGVNGAKKRYAGLISYQNSKDSLEFKGLEVVRSDWTLMAKSFQLELFKKLFAKENIDDLIKETVKKLKNGFFDKKISYKKKLTKNANEYTKNIPPHVRAALLLDPRGEKEIRYIEYIITYNGPEPIDLTKGRIDYDHYIEKQLKPIANGVLFLFDKTFDDIIIGDQLSLDFNFM